jgi:hypothetical protein
LSGYLIVICIMLIMFAVLAIFVAQADADERRFLTDHEYDPLLLPVEADRQDETSLDSDEPAVPPAQDVAARVSDNELPGSVPLIETKPEVVGSPAALDEDNSEQPRDDMR